MALTGKRVKLESGEKAQVEYEYLGTGGLVVGVQVLSADGRGYARKNIVEAPATTVRLVSERGGDDEAVANA